MGEPAADTLEHAMARLADGDRGAFHRVFSELWPIVRRYCLRALTSAADAEDAAQIALEKVFSEAGSYQAPKPVVPWALAIAAWECRTVRRRHQRARHDDVSAADRLVDPAALPPETLERRALYESARAILDELSPLDRETLYAAFSSEADERLTPSTATFRKRKERALERLRAAWVKLHGT